MFTTFDFVARCSVFAFCILALVFAVLYIRRIKEDIYLDNIKRKYEKFLDNRRKDG